MFTDSMSMGAKLASGFGLTLVGMGVVFVSLVLISVALDILRYVMNTPDKTGGIVKPPSGADAGSAVVRTPAVSEQNQEIVAAITAAVSAFTGSDHFVIRSIRPGVGRFSLWGLAGRRQQMNDQLAIRNRKGKRE